MSRRSRTSRESLRSRGKILLSLVAPLTMSVLAIACDACSPSTDKSVQPKTADSNDRAPREASVDTPKTMETTVAYRAKVGFGAELYLPPFFSAKRGGYDLMFHFHGLGKLQEANIERAHLNVAVVSVNLGAGTDPYSNHFTATATWEKLLADTRAEIEKTKRAPNAHPRRIALSAWSAGFVAIPKVMNDAATADKVDAIVLADGFFTSFVDLKKRSVNPAGIERFVKFAEAATRDEKLFAITHTTIPTGPYPSVQECVAKLLEMCQMEKKPSSATGPRNMHEIYTVDRGSFHVHGYQGELAADHVKQIHAMGETLYPLLKARWEKQDAEAANPPKNVAEPAPKRAAP